MKINHKLQATDYKLQTPISSLARLSTAHAQGLEKLGLLNVRDLLFYFPTRYADMTEITRTDTLQKGQAVTLYGEMVKVEVKRSFRGHVPMTSAYIKDTHGKLRLVWFNQAYIGKMYPDETLVKVSGIVQEDSRGHFLSNPLIEKISAIPEQTYSLFKETDETKDISYLTPIYRETKGVSSLYLSTLIKKAVQNGALNEVEDPIPENITEKLHLPKLKDALLYIHFPKEEKLTVAARKRFAFEEVFYMQLKNWRERHLAKEYLSYPITTNEKELKRFIQTFSFTPTDAQRDAITSILADLQHGEPMGRLLEGDVGSGKTFVAATVAHQVISTKSDTGTPLQVAYMAPTEILAKQHFESFIDYFKKEGATCNGIGLLTGSGCKKYPNKEGTDSTSVSKKQLITWLQDGKVSIVIGTHALIQKSVTFANLALIIIDEQHRFGVKQRAELIRRHSGNTKETKVPHLLSMTATPIPRTLALTLFGDLDLTVIDSMPKERKPIMTKIIPSIKRNEMYEHVRKELQNGRQVYVICPRIDEEDEEEMQKRTLKSVKEEAKRLAEIIFPEFVVDIIHSKMKKEEKEEVMQDFLDKKSDILVATSVVEVGVNIPNATVIIIEHAERFGLAQLHQLRGRVGRAEHQSYCYLFTESTSDTTLSRLNALITAKNGFELAELDMKQRGIGTLIDGKQWGLSDISMEAIKNPKLVQIAKEEAKKVIDKDPDLLNHPLLQEIITTKEHVHME